MKKSNTVANRDVYIVDGNRTPFLKANGIGLLSGADLAVAAGSALLNRLDLSPTEINEIIVGCAIPSPDEANIARIIALRLGCGEKVPAYTVMRNCASGMQALDNAALQIASGRSDLILSGGTDAMSHSPLLFNKKMTAWLSLWMSAKTFKQRAGLLTQMRPSYFAPVIALLRGLTDPVVGLNMGQTAEELAFKFNITREQMDAFACESHHRLAKAYKDNRMNEVTPIIDIKGQVYHQDTGIRPDSSVEKLSTLKPFFDKKYGMVTPGNSSQISDGACMLLLASADAVTKHKLPVLGRIVDSHWSGLNPSEMGLGPVHAATPIMQRHKLKPDDFDCWEINEAFAAQVLGCLAAWDDDEYCKTHFGMDKAMGAPSLKKLNKDGGTIAAGHPIGASGARIVLHVLQDLKQHNGTRGMASICIGGGQGGAMYLERVTEVNTHE